MRDPQRTGIDRVVARRDDASCLEVNNQMEVLWINTGIVAIPLFKVDIPLSSECVGLVLSFPGWKRMMRLNWKGIQTIVLVDV